MVWNKSSGVANGLSAGQDIPNPCLLTVLCRFGLFLAIFAFLLCPGLRAFFFLLDPPYSCLHPV